MTHMKLTTRIGLHVLNKTLELSIPHTDLKSLDHTVRYASGKLMENTCSTCAVHPRGQGYLQLVEEPLRFQDTKATHIKNVSL